MRRLFVIVLASVALMGVALPGQASMSTHITDVSVTGNGTTAPFTFSASSSQWNRKTTLCVYVFVNQLGYALLACDGPSRGAHDVLYTEPLSGGLICLNFGAGSTLQARAILYGAGKNYRAPILEQMDSTTSAACPTQ